MSAPPIITQDRYGIGDIIRYAKQYGCGEEVVLLCLSEGILSASADYFGLTDYGIPKSVWDITLPQFLAMKCGDGQFVLRTPSYEMAEACAAEMHTIIEAAEERNTGLISEYALNALLWRSNINTSDIDDLDFDLTLIKARLRVHREPATGIPRAGARTFNFRHKERC